ncbi:Protein-L-isoaspartate O-methyltransferase [Cecembia lonarensis LW9]|uniref:Protein-L-isoaspartate O-methyltransferase n=2 Tax=Cecembia TaxID=1187078 RepID=K1KT61_CECL9|nr:Protein-L-isoaspartate O-methyltransferase [Cecembia lonarensis LW9]
MKILWYMILLTLFQADHFKSQRALMVETQLVQRGIKDKAVLDAMRKVPRHLLVPEKIRDYAYDDRPLPIGEGQTISQPYIVAFMTELIQPTKNMRVLEIGTGSGYQAAVLAEIVKEVYTIEIFEGLGKRAEQDLNALGYTNIHLHIGDGYKGWPEAAPFDAIIVTAAPENIPQPLIDQLAEGGIMVIPVGEEGKVQQLILGEKTKGKFKTRYISSVRFVPFLRENL